MKFPLRSRFLAFVAIASLGLTQSACTQVQVAPGINGEYKLGELQVIADQAFSNVYAAVKRGIADQKLFQTQDDLKIIEAELTARDSADTLVIIKIKGLSPKTTSVKIRYGIPGDLAPAQRLYESIEKRY